MSLYGAIPVTEDGATKPGRTEERGCADGAARPAIHCAQRTAQAARLITHNSQPNTHFGLTPVGWCTWTKVPRDLMLHTTSPCEICQVEESQSLVHLPPAYW